MGTLPVYLSFCLPPSLLAAYGERSIAGLWAILGQDVTPVVAGVLTAPRGWVQQAGSVPAAADLA